MHKGKCRYYKNRKNKIGNGNIKWENKGEKQKQRVNKCVDEEKIHENKRLRKQLS
jgi:hypothetical protein